MNASGGGGAALGPRHRDTRYQTQTPAAHSVDWSIITAATLMTSGPLLIAFLLFERQFVQRFMRAGIR